MGCTESTTREETNGFVIIDEIPIEQKTVAPQTPLNTRVEDPDTKPKDASYEVRRKLQKKRAKQLMEKFNADQIETLREAFNMFDKDGNGMISAEELMTVMKNLGMKPSEQEIKDIINEFDLDNSEHIEFEEFCALMARRMNEQATTEDPESELFSAFQAFDKDGSGKICEEELRTVMNSLGEKLTQEELREMIREADVDGDGEIDYKEFVNMMMTKA